MSFGPNEHRNVIKSDPMSVRIVAFSLFSCIAAGHAHRLINMVRSAKIAEQHFVKNCMGMKRTAITTLKMKVNRPLLQWENKLIFCYSADRRQMEQFSTLTLNPNQTNNVFFFFFLFCDREHHFLLSLFVCLFWISH